MSKKQNKKQKQDNHLSQVVVSLVLLSNLQSKYIKQKMKSGALNSIS